MTEHKALTTLPNAISDNVEVNKLFKILPEELRTFSKKHQKFIEVPIPHSHIGTKPVSCRLMSANRHEGMVCDNKSHFDTF